MKLVLISLLLFLAACSPLPSGDKPGLAIGGGKAIDSTGHTYSIQITELTCDQMIYHPLETYYIEASRDTRFFLLEDSVLYNYNPVTTVKTQIFDKKILLDGICSLHVMGGVLQSIETIALGSVDSTTDQYDADEIALWH